MPTVLHAGTGIISSAPTCNAIYPATGVAGNTVTVTGTNFTSGSVVTINGNAGTSVVVKSRNALTCVVPAGSSTGNVIVTTPSGSGTLTNGWTYTGGGVNARAWFADWSTRSVGSSATTDICDGSGGSAKFGNTLGGGSSLVTVQSATGLGFADAFPNVLQAEFDTTAGGLSRMVETTTGKYSSPSVGNSIWYRTYFNCQFPNGFDTGGNGNHPLESDPLGPPGAVVWEWKFTAVSGGFLTMRFTINGAQTYPTGRNFQNSGVIARNAGYRMEWAIGNLDGSHGIPGLAIYDSSNALVADSSTFIEVTSGNSLQTEQAGMIALTIPSIDLTAGDGADAQFQDWAIGNNGPGPVSRASSSYIQWGPCAVSLVGQVGAWNSTDH